MLKKILLIAGGFVLVLGGIILSIYKTCSITYISDKAFSPDGTYYIQAQTTECVLLDRYTTDVIITHVKHNFLEKLNGSATEDVLILKGSKPAVTHSWEDERTVKIKYSQCRGPYGKKDSWRDIKVVYEGTCSDN